MTDAEIDALEPGPATDAKVAEAMGWKWRVCCTEPKAKYTPRLVRPNGIGWLDAERGEKFRNARPDEITDDTRRWHTAPRYSTDPAAAMGLLEQMAKEGHRPAMG